MDGLTMIHGCKTCFRAKENQTAGHTGSNGAVFLSSEP